MDKNFKQYTPNKLQNIKGKSSVSPKTENRTYNAKKEALGPNTDR